jgi:preprotein translocase subunit SecY
VRVVGTTPTPLAIVTGWVPALLVPPYVYFLAFFILILGFTFFYVSVTFNPDELSDSIRNHGGFVPGMRPGAPSTPMTVTGT